MKSLSCGLVLVVAVFSLLANRTRAQTMPDHRPERFDQFLMLSQPYITNISAYNPIFFLFGTNLADSKFQISLKYRLFEPEPGRYRWLDGINFGYTQTSFWDLRHRSLPFKDTSYKPELFYHTTNLAGQHAAWADGLFFKGGLRHESNGRGGPDSRSTNTAYLRAYFMFYNPEKGYGLRISPLVRVYVANDDDTNADLPDYRGYFGLHVKAGWAEGLILASDMRWAARGGSYTIDATFPVRTGYMRVYFHAEYASVLAESLISYRERTRALRLGFSFVR